MIILKIILFLFICLVVFLFLIYIKQKINWDGFRDWKEYIPYYKRKIDLAEQEADDLLQSKLPFKGDGYCYQLWEKQQEILKEKYKINWKSPADLNEHNLYD